MARSITPRRRGADSRRRSCYNTVHEGVLQLRQRQAGRGRGRADPRRRQPGDRREVRHRPAVRTGRRRRGDGGRRGGVPRLARHDAVATLARPVPHRRRDRGPRRRARRHRGREHRQADRADAVGGDPADDRPDPLLRRRGAQPRGQERRRVHGQHDVVGPARAGRRVRPGRPVELSADDGGVEVRPGDRRRQHRRAQAERHDPGEHDAPRRDRRRVPPARRAQRHLRRPRHRPGDGRPRHAGDGLRHRVGARRQGGRRQRRRRASSGSTSSSVARRRSSSSTMPTSPPPPRRSPSPATSTPARTARRPRA